MKKRPINKAPNSYETFVIKGPRAAGALADRYGNSTMQERAVYSGSLVEDAREIGAYIFSKRTGRAKVA